LPKITNFLIGNKERNFLFADNAPSERVFGVETPAQKDRDGYHLNATKEIWAPQISPVIKL